MFSLDDKIDKILCLSVLYYLLNIPKHVANNEETGLYIHWTWKLDVYYGQNISDHIIVTINVTGYLKH